MYLRRWELDPLLSPLHCARPAAMTDPEMVCDRPRSRPEEGASRDDPKRGDVGVTAPGLGGDRGLLGPVDGCDDIVW